MTGIYSVKVNKYMGYPTQIQLISGALWKRSIKNERRKERSIVPPESTNEKRLVFDVFWDDLDTRASGAKKSVPDFSLFSVTVRESRPV